MQYLSVHLDAEALGNKRCRENWICVQLHCAGALPGSAGCWMVTRWIGKKRETELGKTVGVQECLRDRQRSYFGRAEAAGTRIAQPGLQGLGSRREHPRAMQPFAALFANFCRVFSLFSK